MISKKKTKPSSSSNKSLGVLFLIIAVITNKWIIEAMFSSDGSFDSLKAALVLNLNTTILLILSALGFFGKLNFLSKKIPLEGLVLSISSLILFVFAIVGLDRLIGSQLAAQLPFPHGINYVPNIAIEYNTPEFSFTAKSNLLGIRGSEVDLNPPKETLRIFAIGDSFTFGWGVEEESTWVYKTEKKLNAQGENVQILNLGLPGITTDEFVTIAETATKGLETDLIILNVLLGDDVAQLVIDPPINPKRTPIKDKIDAVVRYNILQNWDRFRAVFLATPREKITDTWSKTAAHIYSKYPPETKDKVEQLDKAIKELFFSGKVNPWIINQGLTSSRRYMMMEDLGSDKMIEAEKRLIADFKRISEIAQSVSAKVIVIGTPLMAYTCEADLPFMKRLGFEVDSSLIQSNNAEQLIESASKKAGIPFNSALPFFRKHCDPQEPLFFKVDTHFTERGNELYARFMTRVISKLQEAAVEK